MLCTPDQRPHKAVAAEKVVKTLLFCVFLQSFPGAACVGKPVESSARQHHLPLQFKLPRQIRFADELELPSIDVPGSTRNKSAAAWQIREWTGKQEPGKRRASTLWKESSAPAGRYLVATGTAQTARYDQRRKAEMLQPMGTSVVIAGFQSLRGPVQTLMELSLRRDDTTTPAPKEEESSGSGATIGIVVGGVVAIILAGCCVFWLTRSSQREREDETMQVDATRAARREATVLYGHNMMASFKENKHVQFGRAGSASAEVRTPSGSQVPLRSHNDSGSSVTTPQTSMKHMNLNLKALRRQETQSTVTSGTTPDTELQDVGPGQAENSMYGSSNFNDHKYEPDNVFADDHGHHDLPATRIAGSAPTIEGEEEEDTASMEGVQISIEPEHNRLSGLSQTFPDPGTWKYGSQQSSGLGGLNQDPVPVSGNSSVAQHQASNLNLNLSAISVDSEYSKINETNPSSEIEMHLRASDEELRAGSSSELEISLEPEHQQILGNLDDHDARGEFDQFMNDMRGFDHGREEGSADELQVEPERPVSGTGMENEHPA